MKKRIVLIAMLTLIILIISLAIGFVFVNIKIDKTKAIDIARKEAEYRYNMNMEEFVPSVSYDINKNNWIVVYRVKDAPPGLRGGGGPYVVIDAQNGEIINIYLIE